MQCSYSSTHRRSHLSHGCPTSSTTTIRFSRGFFPDVAKNQRGSDRGCAKEVCRACLSCGMPIMWHWQSLAHLLGMGQLIVMRSVELPLARNARMQMRARLFRKISCQLLIFNRLGKDWLSGRSVNFWSISANLCPCGESSRPRVF